MPPFKKWISQLYIMVNESNDKSVIDWNPNGNGFIIKDYTKFVAPNGILSKYYPNASSYSTFIRSLAYYNFSMDMTLSKLNVKVYSHNDKLFYKNCENKLNFIIRKSTINTKSSIKKKRVRSNSNKNLRSKKIKREVSNQNDLKEIIEDDDYFSSESEDVNINIERSNAISPIPVEITEQEYQNGLIEDYKNEDDDDDKFTQTTLEYNSDATVLE